MSELISRRFARMEGPAPFSDSISLTQEQWDALSANDLLAMQDARFSAWLARLNEPGAEPEPEPEPENPE